MDSYPMEITENLVRDICRNLGVPDGATDIIVGRMFNPAGSIGRIQQMQVSNRDQAVAVVVERLKAPLWR
jgi:hypothetical protein